MNNSLPPILTSNSQYGTYLTCPRKRYWAYEAVSDPTSATRGWERQRLSLPLSTGSWSHKIAQGLLLLQAVATGWASPNAPVAVLVASLSSWCSDLGLEVQKVPTNASEAIMACVEGYRAEVRQRGLDLGLTMDGQLPEERFVERTIAEQSALLEAFGWAYLRICIANIISEYRLLDVGQTRVSLSDDVDWNPEHDALLERKSDGRRFGYRVEISGNPDRRWKQSREIDHTLLVDGVDGVLIDGFDMGERVRLDPETLRESREHPQPWEGQRNCLVYGYKRESYGRTEYSSKNITQKGWGKFAVWEENFVGHGGMLATGQEGNWHGNSPVAWWVNWLPIEQVEEMFTSFTILRNDKAVESIKRQIVATERRVSVNREVTDQCSASREALDSFFPQNLHVCIYDKCQFFAMCHGEAASDPQKHGFIARQK